MNFKLCIDCKHFEDTSDRCLHEKAVFGNLHSLVRGPVQIGRYNADAMRAGICGKNADLFEPK